MTRVVRLDLEAPPAALPPADSDGAVVVVLLDGTVVGELALESTGLRDPALLREQALEALTPDLREHLLHVLAGRALRLGDYVAPGREPSTSVIVQTRGDAAILGPALEALGGLNSPPLEILVAAGRRWTPALDRACSSVSARLCATRAEAERLASGELLAYTTDRARVDRAWLDDLRRAFADPLVAAAVGWSGPGAGRPTGRARTLCGAEVQPGPAAVPPLRTARALADPACLFAQRAAVERSGPGVPLTELLFRVLASGYRVHVDPARCAWLAPTRGRRARPVECREAVRACLRALRGGPPLQLPHPHADAPTVRDDAPPELSLIVPTHGRRERLRELLVALTEQTHPGERFEAIVVVDGDSDGSAQMARSLRLPYELRVLERENSGVASARNAGVREARHDVLVHLDDDMVPSPGFLAAHARMHASAEDRVVGIGYAAAVLQGRQDLWARYQRAAWEDHYLRKAEPDHPWTYFDYSVGNSSMRRALHREVGGFDEEMRRHDDQELGLRLMRAGARLSYEPAALAWHHFESDFATQLRQVRAQATHDVALLRRHPHLKSQYGAGAMSRPGRSGLSPRSTVAFRLPRASDTAIVGGVHAVAVLERARARRAAARLARDLAAVAYVRGLRDAFGSTGEFKRFIEPVWGEPPLSVQKLELSRRQRPTIPPEGGRVELDVRILGRPLARIEALEAAREYDRLRLAARVAYACLGPAETVISLTELLDVALAPPGEHSQ